MSGVSNGIDVLTRTFSISDAAVGVYTLVKGDVDETTNILAVAEIASADTEKVLGITQETTIAADQQCAVRMMGTGLCTVNGAAGAIDIGTYLVAGTGGKGVAVTAVDAVAQEVFAMALAPSVADGDIIEVFLTNFSLVEGAA